MLSADIVEPQGAPGSYSSQQGRHPEAKKGFGEGDRDGVGTGRHVACCTPCSTATPRHQTAPAVSRTHKVLEAECPVV